jgi:hypothetical protein
MLHSTIPYFAVAKNLKISLIAQESADLKWIFAEFLWKLTMSQPISRLFCYNIEIVLFFCANLLYHFTSLFGVTFKNQQKSARFLFSLKLTKLLALCLDSWISILYSVHMCQSVLIVNTWCQKWSDVVQNVSNNYLPTLPVIITIPAILIIHNIFLFTSIQ